MTHRLEQAVWTAEGLSFLGRVENWRFTLTAHKDESSGDIHITEARAFFDLMTFAMPAPLAVVAYRIALNA